MKVKQRNVVVFFIAAVLIFFAALFYLENYRQGVIILAYHKVDDSNEQYSISPAEFERQISYLAESGYHTISLKDMYEAFSKNQKLPAKSIVITFDDGYKDNLENALPIMEKYGMKGTVFVLAGSVGQPDYLSWQDIKKMQSQKTEIGSHTFSHYNLSELDSGQQIEELKTSKTVLEEKLGTKIDFLAYPFGAYNKSAIEGLQKSGYLGACTGKYGLNTDKTNLYLLKRVNVPLPRYGLTEFKLRIWRARLSGILSE